MRLLIITQKVDSEDDILGFFCYWIKHISRHFDEVKVIALSKGKYELPANVEVVSLGKERDFSKFAQGILFYFFAFKFLRKTDGVFVHMAPEYVRALHPLNIFFNRPIVMWYAHIKVSGVAKWAINHVDKILSPSKDSFEIDSEKVISTGHGIDTDIFKPLRVERDNSKKKILAISRVSRVKRIETLIEALNILVNEMGIKNLVVNIVGGPARKEDALYLSELKQMVKDFDLEDFIEWISPVANKDTPALYNSSDIFVRLQGGGGFGKTELESMACGTPILVPTPVYKSFLGEFSEDTYFPEDNSEKCAQNIAKIIGWDEEQREKYSRLARDLVVKKHNIELLAQRIGEIFNKKNK